MAQGPCPNRSTQKTQHRLPKSVAEAPNGPILLHRMRKTESISRGVVHLLVSCSSEQGFSQVAYGALTDAEPTRRPEYLPAAVTVNFPSAWCERYAERRYNAIDPVVRRTTMQSAPFLWDQLAHKYQLQPGEMRVLNEAKEAGLKHGVTVPLFGPFGQLSVASFASRFDDVDPEYRLSRLNALAWQFHHAFAEIRAVIGG